VERTFLEGVQVDDADEVGGLFLEGLPQRQKRAVVGRLFVFLEKGVEHLHPLDGLRRELPELQLAPVLTEELPKPHTSLVRI
jgi:hypothetical protein